MGDPGPLIGSGRASDVYDIGGGRVLRRSRIAVAPDQVAREVAVMRHVAAHHFPVPEVVDTDGTDVVMQRLDGVTMLSDIETRPWRAGRHADTWAALHRQLAAVPVGDLASQGVVTRFGAAEAVLHLDFHPDNIMLTPDGPVVFDWPNAALGPAAADVALSWIIGTTSTIDGPPWRRTVVAVLRNRFVDRFVDRCGRAGAIGQLPAVAEYRLADRNVRPDEADRIRALVASLA